MLNAKIEAKRVTRLLNRMFKKNGLKIKTVVLAG